MLGGVQAARSNLIAIFRHDVSLLVESRIALLCHRRLHRHASVLRPDGWPGNARASPRASRRQVACTGLAISGHPTRRRLVALVPPKGFVVRQTLGERTTNPFLQQEPKMAQQIESTDRAAEKRRQAKSLIDEALDNLAGALEQGKSQSLATYLAAMAKFHRYSFGNILLIASQRPDASRVAGYRTWQQLGRQVKHGEKGILIFAPMYLRNRADDPSPDSLDGDDPDKLLRFRVVHVFDVSQTEGEALPEHATVNGDPVGFTDRLKTFAAESGIAVDLSADIGSAHGYSRGGRIVLRDDLSPAEEFSTLVHELAHEFLHHGDDAIRGSKTVRETEAEAVAFVVSQAIGLDTNTASSDYIQLYAGDKDTLSQSLDRIQRTASRILAAITDDDATADE